MTNGINGDNLHYLEAARLIEKSRLAVFFTGAGISTPSGIPDFRGNEGLWTRENPMAVASLTVFHDHPERFFKWFHPLVKSSILAKPNLAHTAIGDLENQKQGVRVITQNIDHLHSRAGSTNVIELHGSIETAICSSCGKAISGTQYLPAFIETKELPRCSACHGVLKPGIVLFEEVLPQDKWKNADILMEQCDLIVVVGSSLEVFPAASLPHKAIECGARLIIINKSPTQLDNYAEIVIRNDIINSVPGIIKCLKS